MLPDIVPMTERGHHTASMAGTTARERAGKRARKLDADSDSDSNVENNGNAANTGTTR